jgi:ribulose-5-phosphate 4-epimerase/fuculose-1-phosphate aldolase
MNPSPPLGRRALIAALGAAGLTTLAHAHAHAQPAAPPPSAGPPDPQLLDDLVAANHILVDQGVLDGFGHVTARHDRRPDRFLMSRSIAPGSVTEADIMEFDLEGAPVDARGRAPYLERFIHSEIYRARPDVRSVVHSHSPSVIPFTVSATPLRPVYHMAGFMGGGVPVFEMRDAAGPASDMLVGDPRLGRALAAKLGPHNVVLMRGHGWVTVGSTVRTAVLHAVYTEVDARAQAQAMALGPVNYLNDAEAAKVMAQNDRLVDRAWDIWRAKALGK